MKKLLTLFRFLLPASSAVGQNPALPAPAGYNVFFYEKPYYAGRAEQVNLLSITSTRNHSMAGLNNRVGSVKVPKGFVVILYENADKKGGYGKDIELTEDCPDLSVYGWSSKVVYAYVFFSVRPGGRYVKSKKVNGKTVPGHWEAIIVPLSKPKSN